MITAEDLQVNKPNGADRNVGTVFYFAWEMAGSRRHFGGFVRIVKMTNQNNPDSPLDK